MECLFHSSWWGDLIHEDFAGVKIEVFLDMEMLHPAGFQVTLEYLRANINIMVENPVSIKYVRGIDRVRVPIKLCTAIR